MTDIGIALPQTLLDDPFEPARMRRWLSRAEDLGYHSVWGIEQVLGRTPVLESVTTLSWAAALTTRVKLGVAVLIVGLRDPVLLARQLASLDVVSQGRLIAGVGLGGNVKAYPAYGLSPDGRVSRFTEGIKLMKRLWTEPSVTQEGRFVRLRNVAMEPKPAQKPHPPLWFGGHHPDALARAVALGDGFIGAGSATPAAFMEELRQVQKLLAASGRDPARFTLGKRVYLAIDQDRARAQSRLQRWFASFYGKAELADQVAVWGTQEQVVEHLRTLKAAGAGFLLLHPVFDFESHLEALAETVNTI